MKTAMRLLPVIFLSMSVSAMAGILGSKHDLRGTGGGAGANNITGLTEICLPCHTPHNAQTNANMQDPLWNHALAPTTGFTHYTTLSGNTGDVDGASRMCLGCHDGNTALDSYGGAVGTQTMTAVNANFGVDLSNDHPIGITYPSSGSYDTAANVKTAGLRLPNNGTNDRVECQSCHDPHKTSNSFFLRIDNTDSALCRTCHTL